MMSHIKSGPSFPVVFNFHKMQLPTQRQHSKVESVGLFVQHENGVTKSHEKIEGYSFPLCSKIVEILGKSINKFNIQTLHVLGHNTRQDSEGNAYPIFNGFLVIWTFRYGGSLLVLLFQYGSFVFARWKLPLDQFFQQALMELLDVLMNSLGESE